MFTKPDFITIERKLKTAIVSEDKPCTFIFKNEKRGWETRITFTCYNAIIHVNCHNIAISYDNITKGRDLIEAIMNTIRKYYKGFDSEDTVCLYIEEGGYIFGCDIDEFISIFTGLIFLDCNVRQFIVDNVLFNMEKRKNVYSFYYFIDDNNDSGSIKISVGEYGIGFIMRDEKGSMVTKYFEWNDYNLGVSMSSDMMDNIRKTNPNIDMKRMTALVINNNVSNKMRKSMREVTMKDFFASITDLFDILHN